MEIKQYRKKPVVIQAMLWDGSDDCWTRVAQWLGGDYGVEAKRMAKHGGNENVVCIHTLEGWMDTCVGDYIIKGVKDEFYPCKPDIFEATYDEVAKMPLLNYTTTVPADRSIAAIQKALAKAGASAVMHEYDDNGHIIALSFKIKFPDGQQTAEQPVPEISFRLPTDWRAVHAVLEKQRVEPRYRSQDHALRVAWRITKDWVEAQLAIIETQMVTTAQVFLPYAVTQNGQTVYQYMANNTNLLLGDGKQ